MRLSNYHDTNLLVVIYTVAPVNYVDSVVICLALLLDVFAFVR